MIDEKGRLRRHSGAANEARDGADGVDKSDQGNDEENEARFFIQAPVSFFAIAIAICELVALGNRFCSAAAELPS